MKATKIVKSRVFNSRESENDRLRRVYINQFMQNDSLPQKITDHLYLGSVGAAYTLETLKSLQISCILTVSESLPPKFPSEFTYKIIRITDEPTSKLYLYFKESVEFIKAAVDKGQNVLVHCFAGVSRSCTIVIAYLIRYFGMEVYSALNFVKRKRPWVNPNYGFYAQLKKYYQQLKEKKVIR